MALLVVAVLGGFGIGTVWTKSDTLVSMLVEPNQLATEMGAAQSFSDPGIRFLVKPGTRHGRTTLTCVVRRDYESATLNVTWFDPSRPVRVGRQRCPWLRDNCDALGDHADGWQASTPPDHAALSTG